MEKSRAGQIEGTVHGLSEKRVGELIDVYRGGLLNDVVPFWIRHAVDREHGGFMTCLDRDGTVIDTDKGVSSGHYLGKAEKSGPRVLEVIAMRSALQCSNQDRTNIG